MSANNHRRQEVKNFHQQAGYMRAMISSHIKDQMSCKPEWVHICTNAACAGAASYRIAFGPQAGGKAFALQTVSARGDRGSENKALAEVAGFSLHADVAIQARLIRSAHRRHTPNWIDLDYYSTAPKRC